MRGEREESKSGNKQKTNNKVLKSASLIAQLVKNPPAMQETPVRFPGWEDLYSQYSWASLVALLVKNPPTMQETWVQFLGQEEPLEKG